jgi:hypothetical protein
VNNYGGVGHISVGVEIEPDSPVAADHPHLTAQYQELKLVQDTALIRETATITMSDFDDLEFIIMFKDPRNVPADEKDVPTEPLLASATLSASDVQSKITSFYSTVTGAPPTVTKTCLDDLGMD